MKLIYKYIVCTIGNMFNYREGLFINENTHVSFKEISNKKTICIISVYAQDIVDEPFRLMSRQSCFKTITITLCFVIYFTKITLSNMFKCATMKYKMILIFYTITRKFIHIYFQSMPFTNFNPLIETNDSQSR